MFFLDLSFNYKIALWKYFYIIFSCFFKYVFILHILRALSGLINRIVFFILRPSGLLHIYILTAVSSKKQHYYHHNTLNISGFWMFNYPEHTCVLKLLDVPAGTIQYRTKVSLSMEASKQQVAAARAQLSPGALGVEPQCVPRRARTRCLSDAPRCPRREPTTPRTTHEPPPQPSPVSSQKTPPNNWYVKRRRRKIKKLKMKKWKTNRVSVPRVLRPVVMSLVRRGGWWCSWGWRRWCSVRCWWAAAR